MLWAIRYKIVAQLIETVRKKEGKGVSYYQTNKQKLQRFKFMAFLLNS